MNSHFKKVVLVILVGSVLVSIFLYKKNSDQPKELANTRAGENLNSASSNSHSGLSGRPLPIQGNSNSVNRASPNENPQYKAMLEAQAKKRLEMAKIDLKTLNDSKENFGQFASALMRLSTQRNAAARDKARELLNSKEKNLQMIAFRALGYFDEAQVNQDLEKIIKSDDKVLSSQALQSLAWNPQVNSGRKEILENYLKSEKIESQHSLIAMGALYRMTSDKEDKSNYFNKVLEIAKKPGASGEKFMATRTLMQMDSKSQTARELMKELESERQKKRVVR